MQYYMSSPKRPNVYLAVLKAMLPTRKTWKQDLVDYGKVFLGVFALWFIYTGFALITP